MDRVLAELWEFSGEELRTLAVDDTRSLHLGLQTIYGRSISIIASLERFGDLFANEPLLLERKPRGVSQVEQRIQFGQVVLDACT